MHPCALLASRLPRRTGLSLLVICAAAALACATPASATTKERLGDRIHLGHGADQTFPAGQPFHVAHGWGFDFSDGGGGDGAAVGKHVFTLAVDGVLVQPAFVDKFYDDLGAGFYHWRFWVFNFPDGMGGTHTFTGTWWSPCQAMVDSELAPGPCEKRTEPVVALGPITVTVQFTP